MKDEYKITKNVKIVGTLDSDVDTGEKFIVVNNKDYDNYVVKLDSIIDELLGTQICIKSESTVGSDESEE